jgi:predicted dehydrogenase
MLKIGQIGMEHDHANAFMECVRKYPDIFSVVGVADTAENIKKHSKDRFYEGLAMMSEDELRDMSDLDAVLVETEELRLVETAQKCVERGLPVHMDKPAGASVPEFAKLLNDAKAKNLTLQLGYMLRYNPAVQYCLDMKKKGIFGEIFQADAIMNRGHYPDKRQWLAQFPGGNMFYLGCHMVDLFLLFMGAPLRIHAMNKSTSFDGVTALDNGLAVFEYPKGHALVRKVLAPEGKAQERG